MQLFKTETLGTGAYGAVCKAKCDELICAAKLLYPVLFEIQPQAPERGNLKNIDNFFADLNSSVASLAQQPPQYHPVPGNISRSRHQCPSSSHGAHGRQPNSLPGVITRTDTLSRSSQSLI